MKYPLLTVPYIPHLYKHCSTVYMFHMEFKNIGFIDDGSASHKESYLKNVQQKAYTIIEDYYIVNMATSVSSNDQTFVIFKETLPKKQFISFIENLMAEISIYTTHGIEIHYRVLPVMLFERDRAVKIFAMRKAGDELMNCIEWKNNKQIYIVNKHPKGKYFLTYEEYCTLLMHRSSPSTTTNKAPHASNEEITENYIYYI